MITNLSVFRLRSCSWVTLSVKYRLMPCTQHHTRKWPHRWMASLNECPICLEPFVFDLPSRHALCLPCGHTVCRLCLSLIQSQQCPTCRTHFFLSVANMPQNFMLHNVLAATAAAVSWPMRVMGHHANCMFKCGDPSIITRSFGVEGQCVVAIAQQHSGMSTCGVLTVVH